MQISFEEIGEVSEAFLTAFFLHFLQTFALFFGRSLTAGVTGFRAATAVHHNHSNIEQWGDLQDECCVKGSFPVEKVIQHLYDYCFDLFQFYGLPG
ncbi:hypothetical protein J7E73_23440 [Paenibacillus albidus]|uniref:hypothetical protein n=1 Tax=Paenibacillus albidus TaxID=2041023 RepID=UPI001BE8165A|nr:hypothetical protein [Paenibacillus albidus]MBT2292031.1 hypothetical protein [Paenibacillus albidus]